MPLPRAFLAFVAFTAGLILPLSRAHAAPPEYKLGDIATEDVVTPVALVVVNPEATSALKEKVAQQVPFIVLQSRQSLQDAEQELRTAVARARADFVAIFQRAAQASLARPAEDAARRSVAELGLEVPAFAETVQAVAINASKDLPLEQLAPLWAKGQSDQALVESLLQPLREVMSQPIIDGQKENPLPLNQPLRLVRVANLELPPSAREIEAGRAPGKIITLFRARRLVETSFPSGQEKPGRFAASFVRSTAFPDENLTQILRTRRMEGVTSNDTYEAAQVVLRKGQVVDRTALSALGALREKSLIGSLQAKLEQEKTVATQLSKQTTWILTGLGLVGLALILVFWRLRSRPADNSLPVLIQPALPGMGRPGLLEDGGSEAAWRNRALVAERKAERAQQAIRAGVLGWMREKVFHSLFQQRAELLSVQQKAEAEMGELEQRLERLHAPLQERISAYEQRIVELEKDLAAKGEENRELIGARIDVARQRLSAERGRFGSN